jgi:beta-phosphoglucomutase
MTVGYILDLDGVITDTAEFHYRAWKRLADEEGLPFERADNEALRGVPRRRSLEILLKGRVLSEAQMQAWMERKNVYYREFLNDITPDDLLPGVWNFLLEAKANEILLGLGSASKNAREVCERLGILSLFDAFGDGYSVVNAKPAADIFIWVAGRFGLPPEQCIVFEDAEAGIAAALQGGFWAVGLGPQERVGKAHRVREALAGAHVHDFALPLH